MSQIHPSAIIHENARLDDNVTVGPNCVIESGAQIGSGTILGPNVIIGEDVKIGKDNRFFPYCVIGGQPQILGLGEDKKLGSLIIGDRNTIREQVTIHPSMISEGVTEIGSDNLLMIGVHIGHDCIIEDKIVMSNYVQVSGHCKIEIGAWLSGMVLIHQFTTIGKWCYAAGMAGINHDIPPFVIVSGHYPPEIRGVNKRGLKRAGLNEKQQEKIFEAYKKLYRTKKPLMTSAESLSKEDWIDDNVKAMLDVIIKSSQQRFGRYLEQFRH